jgi:glucose-1-phosphate thymidylyltransferase
MPFVYLRGPLWIGRFSRIQAHATIKDATTLADHTRVGGEVTGAIIEAYSNKQHDGFLGHSYVGSWINLGAGTTNSDLKNSYGNVRIQVGDQRVDSGMQLLGCVMGSYAKTAIHTRIMTGKLIGVNSLVYGTVSENIPDFVNYVSAREELTAVDLATAVQMQARMFARRDVQQQEYHRQLLRDVYQMTSPGRVGLRQGPPKL